MIMVSGSTARLKLSDLRISDGSAGAGVGSDSGCLVPSFEAEFELYSLLVGKVMLLPCSSFDLTTWIELMSGMGKDVWLSCSLFSSASAEYSCSSS